jgi:hypothetical protein
LDQDGGRNVFAQDHASPVMGELRDVGVLAVLAAEIAARRRYGKRAAAGLKMKEGFFLDGVYISRNDLVVHEAIEHAIPVLADRADAAFPGQDKTAMAAEAALYLSLLSRFLKHRCFHGQIPRQSVRDA